MKSLNQPWKPTFYQSLNLRERLLYVFVATVSGVFGLFLGLAMSLAFTLNLWGV